MLRTRVKVLEARINLMERAICNTDRGDNLEQRIRQLECFANGGHKYKFKEEKKFLSLGVTWNGCYVYIFACDCGHEIAKSKAELTKAETKALEALGVIKGKSNGRHNNVSRCRVS